MKNNKTIKQNNENIVTPNENSASLEPKGNSDSTLLQTLAKVFMLISTICCGIVIIPLVWMLPMTIHYFKCVKQKQQPSLGFEVCTILFVSLVAGILMICGNDKNFA